MDSEAYVDRLGLIRAVVSAVTRGRVGSFGTGGPCYVPEISRDHADRAFVAIKELVAEGPPPERPSSEPALMIFDLDIARAKVVLAACAWCDAHGLGDGERVQDALHDAVDEYGAILARIEARNQEVHK